MSEQTVLQAQLASDPLISKYLDLSLQPPKPYHGTGPIRLLVLGQDPTVKRQASRARINTVLNLDRPGSLRRYLDRICRELGLALDVDVYATNFANVFFKRPPASMTDPDVLALASKYCVPHLLAELAAFPNAPILALGEPLLRSIARSNVSSKVRHYWGYHKSWKQGTTLPFAHLLGSQCILGREVFPFPHQPSLAKRFYADRLHRYVAYMRAQVSRGTA